MGGGSSALTITERASNGECRRTPIFSKTNGAGSRARIAFPSKAISSSPQRPSMDSVESFGECSGSQMAQAHS